MPRKYDPGYSFRSAESLRLRDEQRRDDRSPAQVPLARLIPPSRPGDSEPDDGKRDCARGEWCSSYELVTDGGETRRRPARGYQAFCPKDRRCIETDLAQMPAQFVHLAAEIGNPSKNGQVVRLPFGPRMPVRIDIDTLMRAIVESLSSWHERVADAGTLSYPSATLDRLRRDAITVRDAAAAISPHRIDALLALPSAPMSRAVPLRTELVEDQAGKVRRVTVISEDGRWRATAGGTLGRRRVKSDAGWADVIANLDGADAGMEIFTLRYLCRAVLGETKAKPEELLGVPCRREECDKLALRRAELPSDPDAPVWWSECAECGDRLTEDEYREWTRRYARWAEGRTVPVLENLPGVA